jgi:transposase
MDTIRDMHASLSQLENRREQILQQIKAIDRLRRGSLSRQFFKKARPGAKAPQGPYFVLQGYIQGQKFSQRVPAAQAPQLEPLVANYKRFEDLAEEFVTVTDQITRLEQGAPDAKKNFRRKSGGSASGKPTPSSA